MRLLGLIWPLLMLVMMARRGMAASRQRRGVAEPRIRRVEHDFEADAEARFTIVDYVGWAVVALLCAVIGLFAFNIITATG